MKRYTNERRSGPSGFTLTEVMVAMTVLVTVTLGAMNFQYYAALLGRSASSQMTAIHTAQLLVEDWKSVGGASSYDPAGLDLGFAESDLINADYEIMVDNLPMYVTLDYADVAHDSEAEVTLRKISVLVNWLNDRGSRDGPGTQESSIELSAYVRVDASGG